MKRMIQDSRLVKGFRLLFILAAVLLLTGQPAPAASARPATVGVPGDAETMSLPAGLAGRDVAPPGGVPADAWAAGHEGESLTTNLLLPTLPWIQNDVGASTNHVLAVTAGDLDGDGDRDIVTSGATGEVVIWENDGTPFSNTWAQHVIGTSADWVRSVAVGDLDGDGDLDIVAGSSSGADFEVAVWENDGTPFSDPWVQNGVGTAGSTVYSVAIGDLDGDGDFDIATSRSGRIEVWENDGTPFTGTWNQHAVDSSTTSWYSMALGDLDQDGDPDIVAGSLRGGSTTPSQIALWENDSTPFSGTWPTNSPGSTTSHFQRSILSLDMGDVDNDGDMDFVSGSDKNDNFELIVWKNDGTPFSGNWGWSGAGHSIAAVLSAVLGDVDVDGDLDIVTGGGSREDFEVIAWENDGTPFNSSWSQQDVGASDDSVVNVALGDIDSDEYLDIVSGSNSGEDFEVIVWENPISPTTTSVGDQSVGAIGGHPYRVVLTATVTSDAGIVNDGTVSFQVKDGTTVVGGAAFVTLTNGIASVSAGLPGGTLPGDYTIEANYSGTANLAVSSGTGTLTVVRAPAKTRMYWTNPNIYRADSDGSNVQAIVGTAVPGGVGPVGITLDAINGKVYWTNVTTKKIERADLDGFNREELLDRGDNQPTRIAVDGAGGKMYWTEVDLSAPCCPTYRILRANLDGSNVENLVFLQSAGAIALDVAGGKMYWSDRTAAWIRRANLDGSNTETLISGLTQPYGMALDTIEGKMYWIAFNKIQRASLDGSNIEDVVTTAELGGSVTFTDLTVDAPGSKVYWTSQSPDIIQRANLDGSNIEDLVTTDLNNPYGIALLFPDLAVTKVDDVGGTLILGNSWTWTVNITNPTVVDAGFADGQTILTDNLPNSDISFGTVSVTNVVSITNSANISCALDGNSDLTCGASGAPVTISAGGSFDVQFTATPAAVGDFVNPRSGGICQVDPGAAASEIDESNNTCTDTVTVAQAPTTTSAGDQSTTFTDAAQSITLTATVASTLLTVNQGTVTFQVKDGTTNVGSAVTSAPLTDGTASVTYVLPASTGAKDYTIEATYSGGSNFEASSGTGTLTVNKAPTTVTVDDQNATFDDTDQNVTLTATVTGSTVNQGTVTFQLKASTTNIGAAVTSDPLTDGTASVTYTLPGGTDAGDYTIEVTYSGGSNFEASTGSGTLTVNKAPTTIAVDGKSTNFSDADQNVTLTATVTGSTVNQGTVTFQVKDGTTDVGAAVTSDPLTDGTASVTYTLPGGTVVGDYTIEATYSAGDNFESSSGTGTLTVDKAPTTVTVDDRSATFNDADQNVTLTATVTGSTVDEGTITFQLKDGDTAIGAAVTSDPLTDGTASATYTLPGGTGAGDYTIEASYSGGAKFEAGSGTGTLTVNKAPTTVTVGDQTATYNDLDQSMTLTATVASGAGTVNDGTVTFQIKDGTTDVGSAVTSAPLTDGMATVTYTLSGGTAAKDYTIDATYSGGSNFEASSDTGTLTVNKAPTSVTVDDQSTTFNDADQNVTLTAAVSGSTVNQGTVTFQIKDGTTDVGTAVTSAPLTNGTTSVTYVLPGGTSAGDYTIDATYSGGTNFEASSGIGTLHVNQIPTITDIADQTIAEDGTTGALTFTVDDLETDSANLIVSARSSNTALVPTSNVVLGGTGANRTVTVTPLGDQSGSATVTLTVTDGDSNSASTSFTVTITPVNDAPEADDQSVSTDEDTAKAITLTGSDTEDSPLTFSIVSPPANGTLSGTPPNVTYTPAPDYNGPDSFTFKVNDGELDSEAATVSITVDPVNDPPVADNQSVSTAEDSAKAITLTGSDTEDSPLTFSIVSPPVNGALSGTPPDVTYAPAPDFNGSDSFTFKVNDGELDSNTATVSITVDPVNDPPNAVQDAATTDEDTAVTINVLANDTDPEGDPLTVTDVTQGGNGSVVINGDSTVTYTPNPNFNGTDTFTYTIDDGNGGTDTADASVIVASANDTVNAVDDSATTDEDTVVVVDVLANDVDADSDPLSVIGVTQGTNGAVAINGDNTATYTPDADFNGTDTFTYTVTDGIGGADTAQVTVNVNAVNDAPDAVDDSATTDENTPAFIEVSTNDTDVDGDSLSVTGVSQGTHGSVVIYNNSTVKYTPDANFSGADSFSYTVGDGQGGTDTATVAVTVDAVNDAPDAVDDAATANEDSATTINVLANDSDPEGDSLSVTTVTQGSHGSVAINVDGTVTYTPTLNFNGTDTFNYTISDGNGGSDTAEVPVTVNAVNDVPDAVEDAATPDANTPVAIDVLANDTDVDGDTLSVTSVTQGAHGSAAANADNTVTYTPTLGYSGTDTFTYTVSDGQGGSDTTTVTVVVAPDPNAIDEQDDSGTTNEGESVTIDVLNNDSQAGGGGLALATADALSVVSVTKSGQSSVVVNADGTVTYTPDPDFSGTDVFSYTVSDGQTGADKATVTVTVNGVNDAPDAVNDTATTDEDTETTIDPLANDTDEDGDAPSVTDVTQGSHGAVVVNADDTVTYTPDDDFNGTDNFSYTISDGKGGSDTAIVNVTVNPVNDVPNAVDDAITTNEDTAVTLNAVLNDSDVDGDDLAVTDVTQGANGSVTINGDNTVAYTPNAHFNGTDSFTYTVGDGQNSSDTASVEVTVNDVNDAPSFTKGPDQTADNDAEAQVVSGWATSISAGPADEAGQVLAFLVTNDNNALFAVQPAIDPATGDLTYTPAVGADSSATVTAILKDDGGTASGGVATSPEQTFNITINAAPCALSGNVNDDSVVDVLDIQLVVGDWRGSPSDPRHDQNEDGVITIVDIMLVVAQWGQTCQ